MKNNCNCNKNIISLSESSKSQSSNEHQNIYDEGRIEMLEAFQHSIVAVIIDMEKVKKKITDLSNWAWELEKKLKENKNETSQKALQPSKRR